MNILELFETCEIGEIIAFDPLGEKWGIYIPVNDEPYCVKVFDSKAKAYMFLAKKLKQIEKGLIKNW